MWSFVRPGRHPLLTRYDNPVDHNIDIMLVFLVEYRQVGEFVHFAIDLDALEAAFLQFGKFLAIFTLPTTDEPETGQAKRCEKISRSGSSLAPPLAPPLAPATRLLWPTNR